MSNAIAEVGADVEWNHAPGGWSCVVEAPIHRAARTAPRSVENAKILYLHGFASGPNSAKARYFRERLSAMGARISAPDLEAGDFENLTITSQLDVIEREAAGEPVVLMGSSMGGYLAALYASQHPEVQRVVMMAPAFGFMREWPRQLGQKRATEWIEKGSMEVFHFGHKCRRRVGFGLVEDGARYPEAPLFQQPALIFHGLNDRVVNVESSADYTGRHSNAKLHVVNSDHHLMSALDEMLVKTVDFLRVG